MSDWDIHDDYERAQVGHDPLPDFEDEEVFYSWLSSDGDHGLRFDDLPRPSIPANRPLPYGTLRIAEGDDFASTSEARKAIKESRGRYHILEMQHCFLGDDKTEAVLELLKDGEDGSGDDKDGSTDTLADGGRASQGNEWLSLVAPLSRTLKLYPRPYYASFRVLELSNNNLTVDCLPFICKFLTGNLLLQSLDLGSNHIGGDSKALSKLATALGRCGLRHLRLASNPIMPEGVAAFFDSMSEAGTSLEYLEMSTVHTNSETSQEATEDETLIAAQAIASFISDPPRCRSLHTLFLNGNGFGGRGVRAIVSALVGSASVTEGIASDSMSSLLLDFQNDPFYNAVARAKHRRPNVSLEALELYGNVESDWLPAEPQEDLARLREIRDRYTGVAKADVEAIIPFLDQRARQRRLQKGSPMEEVPAELLRHLSKVNLSLDEWESDFQAAAEIGAGLNATNWKDLQQKRLSMNRLDCQRSRQAATNILSIARTVGCRATRGPHTTGQETINQAGGLTGFSKFLDLPPELRLLILSKLDDHDVLSPRQFSNVISFACEPGTIGYGEPDFDWAKVLEASTESQADGRNLSSTLPAPKWSWAECFHWRAPPRDWSADFLDASDLSTCHRSRAIAEKWERGATSPSKFAFFESTLTHRAEP